MVTFFSPIDAIRWCIAVQLGLLHTKWPEGLLKLQLAKRIHTSDGSTHSYTVNCMITDPALAFALAEALLFSGIRIRMGIHVGTPACRRNPVTGRMDYFGPVVNRSARVTDSAHGGQIICTEVCLCVCVCVFVRVADRAVDRVGSVREVFASAKRRKFQRQS